MSRKKKAAVFTDAKNTTVRKLRKIIVGWRTSYPGGETCPSIHRAGRKVRGHRRASDGQEEKKMMVFPDAKENTSLRELKKFIAGISNEGQNR